MQLRLSVALLSTFAVLSIPVPADAAPVGLIIGEGSLTFGAKSGEDTASASIPVVNTSTRAAVASVTFAPSSATTVRLAHPTSVAVPPQSSLTLPVSLAGLKKLDTKVSGVLVVSGGGAPAIRSVTVTPAPQPAADWPKLFAYGTVGVIAGLWLAIVLVALVAGKGAMLTNRAPGPRWSFESWAAIFTATAALVGTVLGSATLPEVPRQIDKETLVAFSLLFAALAVIAPLPDHSLAGRICDRTGRRPVGFQPFAAARLLDVLCRRARRAWRARPSRMGTDRRRRLGVDGRDLSRRACAAGPLLLPRDRLVAGNRRLGSRCDSTCRCGCRSTRGTPARSTSTPQLEASVSRVRSPALRDS